MAINNHGVVVGGIGEAGWFQPFKYQYGLAGLPVGGGVAVDINDAGEIVVLRDPPSALVQGMDRTSLGGLFPRALNNRGEIVGSVEVAEPSAQYAAIWSNGVTRIIGPTGPGWMSDALDIDDDGVAVGVINYSNGGTTQSNVAAIFIDNQTIPIGALPGFPISHAQSINKRGEILGTSLTPESTGTFRGFLFRAGSLVDLGTLPGATSVHPRALNNLGHVVGEVDDPQGRQRAFLYMDGEMHDLTKFVKSGSAWKFFTANAINDKGQIAGTGEIKGGEARAFLLTPVDPTDNALKDE